MTRYERALPVALKFGSKFMLLFEQLLDEQDWDIYYWCTGERTPPARWTNSKVLARLTVHAKNEGKVIRKMPALS